jgi:hypothetical protein
MQQARTKVLHVRVNAQTHMKVGKLARMRRRSVSDLCNLILERALQGAKELP